MMANYAQNIVEYDRSLIRRWLQDFIPLKIFDIHSHLYKSSHYPTGEWTFLSEIQTLGIRENIERLKNYLPVQSIHGLYFGLPRKSGSRSEINDFILRELETNGTSYSRGLGLASPEDNPHDLEALLDHPRLSGLKVYHCYAQRPDTMNASIPEYAPDWMWELLDQHHGVIMLHIVKDEGIADEDNIRELRRLCRSYPRVKVILAHIARSFNYRNGKLGLSRISDLENVVVDTSAIGESGAFTAAIKALGPQRILWGSDFPVSEMRGRCIATGHDFYWLHPEHPDVGQTNLTPQKMTLVGIESLLALKDASEDQGLTKQDLEDIFCHNAIRLLNPVGTTNIAHGENTGPSMWKEAREVICGGTALMSKQAEMFNLEVWPAYYSKCQGCEVWDIDGKRYVDFVGGVGSVLLGYADPDVNAAIQRRITLGSYCSLVNPDEIVLARKLLELHPWASEGKVRFARTGGEAMAVAIRTVRAHTEKSGIAFCGYHGWHDWYLAANLHSNSALDGHLIPGLNPAGVPRELEGTSIPFTYNDIESFIRAIDQGGSNLAAIVMEPMRSQQPNPQFIQYIISTCKEKSILLIVDEITSGLRYGFPGAHLAMDLTPDLVVYAKAMSNGIPFGTVIGEKSVMDSSESSFISSSYWTDGIGTSAALAVLEKVEKLNVFQRVWEKGTHFQQRLSEVAVKFTHCRVTVTGMPATPSIAFFPDEYQPQLKSIYIQKMMQRGFLVSTYFYLMDAHQNHHFDQFIQAFEEVLGEMDDLVKTGKLPTREGILGKTRSGFGRLA